MWVAIIRYIPRAAIEVVAVILIWLLLAPLIAACVRREGDRYYTWRIFQWAVTHDTDLVAWWRGSYGKDGWLKTRFTQADYDRSRILRWATRVMWIYRNPAYQLSHWLGYDQRGVVVPADRFKDPRWDSGEPNKSFWRAVNRRGQVGFLYQRQWYYWRNYCVEIQLGWKLYRRDPDQRCMLAFRISPFKRY